MDAGVYQRCDDCRELKILESFYARKSGRHSYLCRRCHGTRLAMKYRSAPDAHNRRAKDYRTANPISYLLAKAKISARMRGHEFSITAADLVIPEFCPYLGMRLTNNGDGADSGMSVDRIDSSRGYVPGNVQVISRLANGMKNSATRAQLIAFAEGVLKTEAARCA